MNKVQGGSNWPSNYNDVNHLSLTMLPVVSLTIPLACLVHSAVKNFSPFLFVTRLASKSREISIKLNILLDLHVVLLLSDYLVTFTSSTWIVFDIVRSY